MTINQRVREVRNALSLSQPEFGKAIGLSQSSLTMIETGNRKVTDRTVSSICLVFNISRDWLETGEGEMFREMTADEELAFIFGKALSEDADPRRKKLLKSIINIVDSIPDEALSIVGDYAKQISVALEDEAKK